MENTMLPFKLFHNRGNLELPLALYSCGLHSQHPIYRPVGYPTLQIMICFAGAGTFHFAQKPYMKIKQGNMVIIPSKVPHEYTPSGTDPWVLGYVGIDGEYVDGLIHFLKIPILQVIEIAPDELICLEQFIIKLWHSNEIEEQKKALRAASTMLYDGLTYIASIVTKEVVIGQQNNQTGTNEMLRAAVQFMEQHYMDKVNIANIAHTVGYTQQHFQRKFKELYGVSPNQYLQHLRLLKGAQYLEEDNDLTIGEIAAMIGMELNYFVRMFKREYKQSPAKYRNMLRENKKI